MQSTTTIEEVAILVECADKADIQEIVVPLGSKLREIAVEAGNRCGIPFEEVKIFDQDGEIELDLEVLLDSKYPHKRIHHVHRHKTIFVEVFYGGGEHRKEFPPTAKVERVREWAVREFGIDPVQGRKMELAKHGTKEELPRDARIGRFVKPKDNILKLDLIEGVKPNG